MEPANIIEFKADSETAIIVLHEIYGVNRHILDVCGGYHACGYDVYCPDLYESRPAFSYEQQEQAYDFFWEHAGPASVAGVTALTERLRQQYRHVFLAGFSVGATLAWICAARCVPDGLICFYGSRIRDYLNLRPACPVLAVFAERETSFAPQDVVAALSCRPNVRAVLFDAEHGFCDKYSTHYAPQAAARARELAGDFLSQQQQGAA